MKKEERELMEEWLKDNPDKKVPTDKYDPELEALFPTKSCLQIYQLAYRTKKLMALRELPKNKDNWTQDEVNKLQQWLQENPNTEIGIRKIKKSLKALFPNRSVKAIYCKIHRDKLSAKREELKMVRILQPEKSKTKFNLIEVINSAVTSYIDREVNIKMESVKVKNDDSLQAEILKRGQRINELERLLKQKWNLT